MTVSLQLTSEAESQLKERAATAGTSVEEDLRQLVERQAAASPSHNEGSEGRDLERVRAAVQAIRELAKGNRLGGVSIRELIEERRH